MVGIPSSASTIIPTSSPAETEVIAMALACEPCSLPTSPPPPMTLPSGPGISSPYPADRLGTAMIMITHDLGIVAQTCDNVSVMYAGPWWRGLRKIFTG